MVRNHVERLLNSHAICASFGASAQCKINGALQAGFTISEGIGLPRIARRDYFEDGIDLPVVAICDLKGKHMSKRTSIIRVEQIQSRILVVRGHKVMLDSDLAELYGVPTKRLNEQVKRNQERFPADFMFQLMPEEIEALRSQIATSKDGRGGRRYRPYAFTEHGAVMAATVLNSERAIQISVYVVRAFLKLREIIANHKELAGKLAELEQRVEVHDEDITALFEAIRMLMEPPEGSGKSIGFHARPALAKPKE